MKPYRLQLVQALRGVENLKRIEFCEFVLGKMETDDLFISKLVFSDEATFHTNGKFNRHNVRIWGNEYPRQTIEHERDSPMVKVFCIISANKVFGPFFFKRATVNGLTYLEMLETWAIPSTRRRST